MKKSHAVRGDTLFLPTAAASLRHDGVGSVRCRSADAGKTIVVLFVVICAPSGLQLDPFFVASVMQRFLGLLLQEL